MNFLFSSRIIILSLNDIFIRSLVHDFVKNLKRKMNIPDIRVNPRLEFVGFFYLFVRHVRIIWRLVSFVSFSSDLIRSSVCIPCSGHVWTRRCGPRYRMLLATVRAYLFFIASRCRNAPQSLSPFCPPFD